ncbi:MAG: hypothetical protein IJQ81_03620 [Oscillibacter sp.]|nr:hypothetical protein [Oscillibacter sp.]
MMLTQNKARALSAYIASGWDHTVGLKSDGTVIATKHLKITGSKSDGTPIIYYNLYGELNVKAWGNVVAVAAGNTHTTGLTASGTVATTGREYDNGVLEAKSWKNIVSISAGDYFTVGLKTDGTVLKTSWLRGDVSGWRDIVDIAAGYRHVAALKADGTVVATGSKFASNETWSRAYNDDNWRNIVAIAAGDDFTIGLKSNGTVVSSDNRLRVRDWRDIVAVAACNSIVVGLKSNGTVVIDDSWGHNVWNLSDWRNIVAVSVGSHVVVGLRENGTVVEAHQKDVLDDDGSGVSSWKLFDNADKAVDRYKSHIQQIWEAWQNQENEAWKREANRMQQEYEKEASRTQRAKEQEQQAKNLKLKQRLHDLKVSKAALLTELDKYDRFKGLLGLLFDKRCTKLRIKIAMVDDEIQKVSKELL